MRKTLDKPQILEDADNDAILADVSELVLHYRKYFRFVWSILSEDPGHFNWHIDYIADRLQNLISYVVAREPFGDLCFNLPPGMTKSSLVTQALVGWIWLQDPSICIIVSTYSSGLSIKHSLKAKKVIQSTEWGVFNYYIEQQHGKPLTLVKNTEKLWVNNYGGFFSATSPGGSVQGDHAHIIFRDDQSNPEQALSKAMLKKTLRFNDETLSQRKKNKLTTPTVTVEQRLNEDDSTGHDLKKGIIKEHVCLPGSIDVNNLDECTVKPRKLIDKYIQAGGLLDPVRLPQHVLEDEKVRLGSYGFAGQYDQSPSPIGGGIIKKAWFEILDSLPGGLPFEKFVWNFVLDTAFSSKATANDTALLAYTFHQEHWFIRECLAVKVDFPELITLTQTFAMRNGYTSRSRIYIEPKATGTPLIQTIRKTTGLNVIPTESPIQDKVTRANNHVPEMEAGRVHLLRGDWNKPFLEELGLFPKSAENGRVDVVTYAMGIKGGSSFRVSSIKQGRNAL